MRREGGLMKKKKKRIRGKKNLTVFFLCVGFSGLFFNKNEKRGMKIKKSLEVKVER